MWSLIYTSLNYLPDKANEERAKAAEYGLVLLEEKQHLQYKNEEMTLLYERTKQELETSTIVCQLDLLKLGDPLVLVIL